MIKGAVFYMGSNSLRGWIEAILIGVVSYLLLYVPIAVGDSSLTFSVLPILFIGLRRGLLQGFFAGIVAGILALLLMSNSNDLLVNIVSQFGPLAFIGIVGFFAKFTQRTLNNKRYPNAAVNIITASILGTLVFYLWKFVASLSFNAEQVAEGSSAISHYLKIDGLSFAVTLAANAIVLLLLAKFLPKFFIPKDTPFLSRKEKSKLLND